MFRFLSIIGILSKYFFIYILLKLGLYKKPKQKILKHFFEEAGGSFIKFGQLLALRVDVLPKVYALEMISLFDNIKPFPYREVEKVFLQELGSKPDQIFKNFQKIPFASASFGQVHGAKMADGHIVAVKVLRPGIEEKVKIDFFLITIIAFFADLFFKIEALPWREFAREFKKWTKRELDYYIEADSMAKMYKNVVNKSIVIPKVYPRLSTKKILVEDYIEGIPLSRIFLGLKDGRLTDQKLKERGINIKKIPIIFTQELLREFFMDKIFHADPHPGNILVLPNDKIALVDFGIIGESITYNRTSFFKFMESATRTNYTKFNEPILHFSNFASENLKNMIGSALPPIISEEKFEEIMDTLINHFSETVRKLVAVGKPQIEAMKKDYTVYFMEMIKAAQKYKVKLPNQSVLFIRLLTIIGFLSKQLNEDYRFGDEVKYFFKIHPLNTLLNESDQESPPFKRINSIEAMEQLNSWLNYLLEVDPVLYARIKDKFSRALLQNPQRLG